MNIGADFALMPSLFEPSGVVQQEFFAGGTPVIAFKTGGLKDTIFEYNSFEKTGNGFTFEAHAHGDFVSAVKRALNIFNSAEDYLCLRKNARESVLDVHTQAMGWAREFARLSRRFWSDPESIEKARKEIREKQTKKETNVETEKDQEENENKTPLSPKEENRKESAKVKKTLSKEAKNETSNK